MRRRYSARGGIMRAASWGTASLGNDHQTPDFARLLGAAGSHAPLARRARIAAQQNHHPHQAGIPALSAPPGSITPENWATATSGTWSAGVGWNTGITPGSMNDVTIGIAGAYSVTINAPASAHSLTVSAAGATVLDTATLSITTTLAVAAGTFSLGSGGAVSGGTLVLGPSGTFLTAGGGLYNVTVDGPVSVAAANGALYLGGTDDFLNAAGTGAGALNIAGSGARLFAYDTSTLDGGTLTMGAAGLTTFLFVDTTGTGASTLTLGANLDLLQTGAANNVLIDMGFYANANSEAINDGTITASAAAGLLTVHGHGNDSFVNDGMIAISNTDNFTIDTTFFQNTGTIAINGGTLAIDAAFSTAGLGVITSAGGGQILLNGTMNNAGAVFTQGAAGGTGAFTLAVGGDLNGGTVQDLTGAMLFTGGTVGNVNYQGTLSLAPANSMVRLIGTETFSGIGGVGAGVINLTGANARIVAEDTTSLDNATLNIGSTGQPDSIFLASSLSNTPTLTLGSHLNLSQTLAGSAASIDLSFYANGFGTLINQGTITASAANGTFTISGAGNAVFTNQGTISVSNGDNFVLNAPSWSNSGTFMLNGGTLALGGNFATGGLGTIINNGGLLSLAGTLNNSGAMLTLGAGGIQGPLTLALGGTINGGTIADSSGALASFGGRLNGITYQGTLNMSAANAWLAVSGIDNFAGNGGIGAGVINLTGTNAHLLAVDATALDNATLHIGSTGQGDDIFLASSLTSSPTLTLGSHFNILESATGANALIDLSFYATTSGTLFNQGSITAAAQGGALSVSGGAGSDFINQGLLTASNGGRFNITTAVFTNSGTARATGGGLLNLASAGLTNLAGEILTGGIWEADAGSTLELSNNAAITTDQASIILSGAGSSIQALSSGTNAQVLLDSTLDAIGSAGSLTLLNGRVFSATANGGVFSDAGLLSLGGATFASTSLAVATGGTVSGFGIVQASVADSGTIQAIGGTLTIQGALAGTGALIAAAGATLDLTAGGALTGAISGAGTLKLDGATAYTLATGGVLATAAVLLDAGSTLSGAGKIAGAFQGAGTLSAAAGGGFDLAAGGLFTGLLTGAGTLTLDGAAPLVLQGGAILNTAMVVIDSGATLDFNEAFSLTGSLSGAGTLTLDGAGPFTIAAGTTLGVGTLRIDQGASLTGSGTIKSAIADAGSASAAGGTLTLSGAVSGNGTLCAAAGAVLNLTGGGNFAGSLAGAGTVHISKALKLAAGASLSTANLLQTANVALAAAAHLTNAAGDIFTIAAAGPASTVTLSGAKTSSLANAGNLVASGQGSVHISAAVINTGTVSSTAATLAFLGAVTNNGAIDVASGVMSFNSAVTGTGTLNIGAAATLSLLKGAAIGQTADFQSGTGLLDLTGATQFKGTIADFTAADRIDLLNSAETTFSFANHVLTVKDGTSTVASLHFAGAYTTADFTLASDTHGGTLITFA